MQSDAELIGRSMTGDGEAFVQVISRHEAAVGAYLARRVGRGPADDLLVDVWVAAFESRVSYDHSFPDARPWLFGVARNRLRRYWRYRPAGHPVPDVSGMAAGWDPWPGAAIAHHENLASGQLLRCSSRTLPVRCGNCL